MALNSEAYFDERIRACGLDALKVQIHAKSWTSMRRFAFVCSYHPTGNDDSFMVNIVRNFAVENMTDAVTGLMMLYFEAYSLAMGDLKR